MGRSGRDNAVEYRFGWPRQPPAPPRRGNRRAEHCGRPIARRGSATGNGGESGPIGRDERAGHFCGAAASPAVPALSPNAPGGERRAILRLDVGAGRAGGRRGRPEPGPGQSRRREADPGVGAAGPTRPQLCSLHRGFGDRAPTAWPRPGGGRPHDQASRRPARAFRPQGRSRFSIPCPCSPDGSSRRGSISTSWT